MASSAGGSQAEFQFKHHYIATDLPGVYYGQTALADVDGDGAPEFITGRRGGDIFCFDYRGPDDWVRYVLGTDSPSDVGGVAIDVDGDGWLDFVAGGAWYRNSRDLSVPFERFVFDDVPSVHDVTAADIDGNGKLEVLTQSDKNSLRWYRIPANPTQPWERHDIGPSVHAGLAVGDIDGDGDLDILRSSSWFENVRGNGTEWVEHPIGHFGGYVGWEENATKCAICDMNGDGRNDLVIAEAEIVGGHIYWLENLDGKGTHWKWHQLPHGDSDPRGAYHTLYVGDLDGDGDFDVFSCEMEWVKGPRSPRWFIWENVDGKGGSWVEHVILDCGLGGHEAVIGDVDGDGNLDICSKLWAPWKDNANGGRMHVDFLERV